MKVLGRANGGVWGFIPDSFSKVVGCCLGFYVVIYSGVVCEQQNVGGGSCFCAFVTMFEDFATTFVYVVLLIVVIALFLVF